MANCFGLRTARLGAACPHGRPRPILKKAFCVPWSTPFEDLIVLPDGRMLLTLKDAVAENGIRLAGMANGDRSADVVQPRRAHDDGADRRHASAEPSCRAGVQSRAQRDPLGEAKAEERSVMTLAKFLCRAVPLAQEPGALLKTSSCLVASTSLHFCCRPLRATSALVTGYPRSIPC
jgi:hypothetical protein